MPSLRKIVALAAIAFACSAHAQGYGPTYTYSGLSWDFNTAASGFSGCTTLTLDATGDPAHSSDYAVYGRLYCPNLQGYYSSAGNAYFDSFGDFNLKIDLGVTNQLVCTALSGSTFSGTCTIYTNNGGNSGDVQLTFL